MTAPARTLTRRALNRATLDRQLLLRRTDLTPLQAIEHLVGLQAQTPHTWYVGLWTRLVDCRAEEVAALLTERRTVRIALMRGTIHLVSGADALALRPLMQQSVDRGLFANQTRRKALAGLDLTELVAAARVLLDDRPRTPSELGKLLAERFPGRDPDSLANAIRSLLPVVQTPPRGVWGAGGQPVLAPLESWLGAGQRTDHPIDEVVLRYLAAFGPATVRDVQTWSGLTRLGEVLERLRTRLVTFRDERDAELFDPRAELRPPRSGTPSGVARRFHRGHLDRRHHPGYGHAERAAVRRTVHTGPGGVDFRGQRAARLPRTRSNARDPFRRPGLSGQSGLREVPQ